MNETGAPPAELLPPLHDEQFAWVEVSEQVLGGLPVDQAVVALRIRAHGQISFASLWISRDDVTYNLFGTDTLAQTGGTLTAEFSSDGPTYLATGPEYDELGPDNATLTQDLSSDLTNWGLGRQLAVIVSTAGTEVLFIQKATITGGSTRRMDGVLRARYYTRKLTHPAGSPVFIFDMDAVSAIGDALLEPGEDFYLKTQPGTGAGQVDLSGVPPYGEELYGYGQRPVKPSYVYCKAPFLNTAAFQTGDDITLGWGLNTGTPGLGAGFQSAGVPLGTGLIPGTVTVEYLTTGDVVMETRSVNAQDFETDTITNAELVAAFGGEPTAFKVRITHVANGRLSTVSDALMIERV